MEKRLFTSLSLGGFFFLQVIFLSKTFSQELPKDDIFSLSFEGIASLEDSLYNSERVDYLKKVLDIHTAKAKYFKDTTQLIEVYFWRIWTEEFISASKYADSAIILTKGTNGRKYSSAAHYSKAVLLYDNNFPEASLAEFIIAHDLARIANDHEDIVDCLNAISSLKREYGQEGEAVILQRESLDYLRRHESEINSFNYTHLVTLDNISRCYLQVKELDSARVYTKLGMKAALFDNDIETFQKLNILNAQINYYDKNYIKARDTLLKYVNGFQGTTRADILFYLGMIEGTLGNGNSKKSYFEEFDQILFTNGLPLIDNAKEIYKYLLKTADINGNNALKKKYLERLIYYDSLLTKTEKNIRNVTLMHFDLPVQNLQQSTLKKEIDNKKNVVLFLYVISALLFVLIFFFHYRYKKEQKRLHRIMSVEVKPIKISQENFNSASIDIDQNIVSTTLEKLDMWEINKGFLHHDINQHSLAKELDTNSSYLSKIINTYKQQNFSNYIKDLRITYAINHIKKNPETIANKSTIQVAEHFGFNSLDVFVRALKAKIGITPAVFFRKIKRGQFIN